MPFGSRINNFSAILAGCFITASVIVSIIGMVISNKRVVETVHGNQATIIGQNKVLLDQQTEMLRVLRRVEARYLDGKQ